MPLIPLDALNPLIAARKRLIGLDLGTKTIGVAVADALGMSATPLTTLRRGKFTADAAALTSLLSERQIGAIVLGLPLNMDGTEGPRCQSTRSFAANFLRLHDIPIAFQDERLSTAAVTRMMVEADYSRAKRAELVDGMAASYILQGALDRLRVLRSTPPQRQDPGA